MAIVRSNKQASKATREALKRENSGSEPNLSDASSGSGDPAADDIDMSHSFYHGSTTGMSTSMSDSSNGNFRSEALRYSLNVERTTKRTLIMAIMVVLVGSLAGGGFLWLGINAANNEVSGTFERRANDMAKEIERVWDDYESSALWIHESVRHWRTDNYTREDFEILYNYLTSGGLEFFAAVWVPNVTNEERPHVEELGAKIWGDVPGVENYTGFMGQEVDPETGGLVYAPRSEQPWYFPIHFGEPKANLVEIAHYDLSSAPWERPHIMRAIETWKPAMTARFELLGFGETDGYGVVFYHPGAQLPAKFGVKPRDLGGFGINARSLLTRAAPSTSESMAMYLFDSTLRALEEEDSDADSDSSSSQPEFLAGIEILVNHDADNKTNAQEINIFQEITYQDLRRNSADELYYERDFEIAGRTWTTIVVSVEGTYEPNLTFILLSGCLIIASSILLAIWMINNMRTSIKMNRIVMEAAAEAAIVSNLFPADVRDRLIEDAQAKQEADFLLRINNNKKKHSNNNDAYLNKDGNIEGGSGGIVGGSNNVNQPLTSEGIFGSKPIAELHPYTTIMFADLCGFTAWSSVREPSQVFTLLEILYHGFDSIAARRRVYKVETVGDSYVAVAGLPTPRHDHAVVMARFAGDCLRRFQKDVKLLERTLGPDTGELGIRIGIHSGQVVAGVLRGDKGRFQLFGDSVNMASRIESTCKRNKIQMSQATADLLVESRRAKWVIPRKDLIDAKGFGRLQCYFLNITTGSKGSLAELNEIPAGVVVRDSDKMSRLVEWVVEILSKLLRNILARRQSSRSQRSSTSTRKCAPTKPLTPTSADGKGKMVLDEVSEIITLPEFAAYNDNQKVVDPNSIDLDPAVISQLKDLITNFSNMYRNNPFHNFEHASHVTMSVVKMMGRIVDPNKVAAAAKRQEQRPSSSRDQQKVEAEEMHDHTFGINSDPLTQFACAFSAIIHDLDHQGVPNMTLIKEGSPLASKYKNKSVAEQNSVDLAWDLLMQPKFDDLRACICANDEEFQRFRCLVVNSVMATDIMDKQLGAARKERWNKAFSDKVVDGPDAVEEDQQTQTNRKATIVIEHLIQASDISHTMQHWHIYARWNERLFTEMYKGYKAGRLEKDPSIGWVQGELGFFDFYIIPLAKKLFTCGVFGVSSDEFLNYALINRKEWEIKGEDMVKMYLKNYEQTYGNTPCEDLFDDEQQDEPELRLPIELEV